MEYAKYLKDADTLRSMAETSDDPYIAEALRTLAHDYDVIEREKADCELA